MDLPNVEVVDTRVTALQFEAQIEKIMNWGRSHLSRTVCVANVHMLIESRHNKALKAALCKADLVTPDGMPLAWVMRLLGRTHQDRVAGMDIFRAVCQRCVETDVSIYLLGSTKEVLDGIEKRLNIEFPGLTIAGMESPPFRPLTESEDQALTQRINNSGAGVTFISLGCPKQECWISEHRGLIKSVMVGVGGVFPIYAGLKKQAPEWVRNSGLEWSHRFFQEPKRLFKRYATTIPPFIWLAVWQVFMHKTQESFQRVRVERPQNGNTL